jgi:trehalose synthase
MKSQATVGTLAPLTRVDVRPEHTLDDYAAVASLAAAAAELRADAANIVPRLAGRTIWHVNSTATGGGVAEILLPVVRLLRDLGVSTEWVVIGSSDPAFFALTKRLHNLIHGSGDVALPGVRPLL